MFRDKKRWFWDVLSQCWWKSIFGISSSNKDFWVYKKGSNVIIDESRRVKKLQKKEYSDMAGLLHIQQDGLNSELIEEHPRHESRYLKDANAYDERDEGPGLLDSAEQKWSILN